MSGIVGIWNLHGRPVSRAELASLSMTLAHRGPDGERLWIHGPTGLACQLNRITPEATTEVQPLVHPSGSVLVFDGRLDNREELLARLRPCPQVSSASPDPVLVLATYAEFGDRFAELLAGDFALALFDSNRQRLLLARDALGVRPLYYTRTRDTFLFASEIKALLAHPEVSPHPNSDSLASILLSSAQGMEGMTCFEGVFSLLPAHIAILTTRGFVTGRYWDFDVTSRTHLGSFPEYAEAFRHYFEQAIRRRLRSAYPVAVSVSGGLDSSSVLCLAVALRRRSPEHRPSIFGLSYTSTDGSPSDETAFLGPIESDYGIKIDRVTSPLGLMNGCREAVWHIETPMLDEQWNTTSHFMQAVRQRGARLLLTGHWGDQMLSPQAYLIDLFHRFAWKDIRDHLHEFSRWSMDVDSWAIRRGFVLGLMKYHAPDGFVSFLRRMRTRRDNPWYSDALRQGAYRESSSRPARGDGSATAHARCLYGESRSSHHVQCMEWNSKVAAMHGLEMAFPFLDRDLISFLMAIPGEMLSWKGVPKALLREAMQGVLPDAIVRRSWKADFTHLVNEGMEQDFPQLVNCLQSDAAAIKMGYLKGDVMRAELSRLQDRIRGPSCEVAWRLSTLLALELWLQVFFEANRREQRSFQLATAG